MLEAGQHFGVLLAELADHREKDRERACRFGRLEAGRGRVAGTVCPQRACLMGGAVPPKACERKAPNGAFLFSAPI